MPFLTEKKHPCGVLKHFDTSRHSGDLGRPTQAQHAVEQTTQNKTLFRMRDRQLLDQKVHGKSIKDGITDVHPVCQTHAVILCDLNGAPWPPRVAEDDVSAASTPGFRKGVNINHRSHPRPLTARRQHVGTDRHQATRSLPSKARATRSLPSKARAMTAAPERKSHREQPEQKPTSASAAYLTAEREVPN